MEEDREVAEEKRKTGRYGSHGEEDQEEKEEVLPRTVPRRKSQITRNGEKRGKASNYRRNMKTARRHMR